MTVLTTHVSTMSSTSIENIARWICDNVEHCYRVDVQESEGNTASYEKDI